MGVLAAERGAGMRRVWRQARETASAPARGQQRELCRTPSCLAITNAAPIPVPLGSTPAPRPRAPSCWWAATPWTTGSRRWRAGRVGTLSATSSGDCALPHVPVTVQQRRSLCIREAELLPEASHCRRMHVRGGLGCPVAMCPWTRCTLSLHQPCDYPRTRAATRRPPW